MGLADVAPVIKGGKKSGGMWGSIIGGLAGLGAVAAAPFTAGTSLAALPVALGATAAGAPLLANAISPGTPGSASSPIAQSEGKKSALSVMMKQPDVQLAVMDSSKKAIPQSDLGPDQAKNAYAMLDEASKKLREKMNMGVG